MSTGTDPQSTIAGAETPRVVDEPVLLAVSDLFGRKWHGLVLYHLHSGRKGFSDLKREIDGISGKMLAESLDTLTDDYGVVERHQVNDSPIRVEYSLSTAGEALAPVLLALYDWGTDHLQPDHDE